MPGNGQQKRRTEARKGRQMQELIAKAKTGGKLDRAQMINMMKFLARTGALNSGKV